MLNKKKERRNFIVRLLKPNQGSNKRKPHNIDTLSTSITPIKLWMITLICPYFSFSSIISSESAIFRLWKYRPWTEFIFSCDWTERPQATKTHTKVRNSTIKQAQIKVIPPVFVLVLQCLYQYITCSICNISKRYHIRSRSCPCPDLKVPIHHFLKI